MSPTTIQAFEAGDSDLRRSTHKKLKEFYEIQRIRFLGEHGISSAMLTHQIEDVGNISLFDEDFLRRIDDWRLSRPGKPSREYAIKQLVQISLNNWELED